jgi:hypothetical protein
MEIFGIVGFVIEYLGRVYSAVEYVDEEIDNVKQTKLQQNQQLYEYNYANPCSARFHYVVSFYSCIDMLAIVPSLLSISLYIAWIDENDGYFRMFRLLRLIKLDRYFPSITLIDDAFRDQKVPLQISTFVSGIFWVFFATALYLAEKDSTAEDGAMAERYANVPIAMHVTMIHLTGDYPLIDYNDWGRLINFFMVIGAAGVVGVPMGLIATGFSNVIERDRQAFEAEKQAELEALEAAQKESKEAGGESAVEEKQEEKKSEEETPEDTLCDQWLVSINEWLNGENQPWTAVWFGRLIFGLIILNVLAVVLESVPSIDKYVGNDSGNFFDVFEAFSVIIFTFEFVLRFSSVIKDPNHQYSRLNYMCGFFGLVDILAIFPWYIEFIVELYGASFDVFIFRVFRVIRVLQLEHFVDAFRNLDDVFVKIKPVLQSTGVLALIIWIGSSSLFYLTENGNPNFAEFDSFSSIPNGMYYTAVFLGGEWGLVDFTIWGKIHSVFLCVIGIALFAIPIGTLFDAFGELLGDDEDEAEDGDKAGDEEGKTATKGESSTKQTPAQKSSIDVSLEFQQEKVGQKGSLIE